MEYKEIIDDCIRRVCKALAKRFKDGPHFLILKPEEMDLQWAQVAYDYARHLEVSLRTVGHAFECGREDELFMNDCDYMELPQIPHEAITEVFEKKKAFKIVLACYRDRWYNSVIADEGGDSTGYYSCPFYEAFKTREGALKDAVYTAKRILKNPENLKALEELLTPTPKQGVLDL